MTPLRFAVHGPMYSGKSTLARLLQEREGYTYFNYTDWGKTLIGQALTAMLGRTVTQAEVIARKNEPTMRDFIIAGLRLYGFDEGAGVNALVAALAPDEHAVFDNVRYQSQYAALKPYGFTLVRLLIHPDDQEMRAARAGMPLADLERLRREPSEQPLPMQEGEIRLDVENQSPAALLHELLAVARANAVRQRAAESQAPR